jgi:hypothetical protein
MKAHLQDLQGKPMCSNFVCKTARYRGTTPLRNSSVQESIKTAKAGEKITLPEGVVWLGNSATFSNELFVRACYSEIVEAKEEYFKLSNKKPPGIVYIGTPRIGKSHLCALVVAHELIVGKVVLGVCTLRCTTFGKCFMH